MHVEKYKSSFAGPYRGGAAKAQSSAPAPAGEDWGAQIVDWTNQAVTAYGSLLLNDGMTRACLVVCVGVALGDG